MVTSREFLVFSVSSLRLMRRPMKILKKPVHLKRSWRTEPNNSGGLEIFYGMMSCQHARYYARSLFEIWIGSETAIKVPRLLVSRLKVPPNKAVRSRILDRPTP